MLEASLFLGFPTSETYIEKLSKIDHSLLDLFISDNKQIYLQEMRIEGSRYLGKIVGETVFLSDLILLQENIYSILKKIIPNHPYEDEPLILMAVSSSAI